MEVNVQSERNASTIWYILEDDSLYYPQGMKALHDPELKFFIPCKRSTMDGQIKLSYDISGLETLEKAARNMNREEFCRVLENVIQCILTVRDYGIMKLDTTELATDTIFVDTEHQHVGMIYVPCISPQASAETAARAERRFRKELALLVQKCFDTQMTDMRELGYKIADADGVSLDKLHAALLKPPKDNNRTDNRNKTKVTSISESEIHDEQKTETVKQKTKMTRKTKDKLRFILAIQCIAVVAGSALYFLHLGLGTILALILLDAVAVLLFLIRKDVDKPEKKKTKPAKREEKPAKEKAVPKKETAHEAGTDLLVEFAPSIRLTGLNTPTKFVLKIDKEEYRIGRVGEDNDGVVSFEKTVSGHHCTIKSVDGINYIIDNNSKNGTKLNGNRLDPNKEYRLQIGDTLKISRLEFSVDAY